MTTKSTEPLVLKLSGERKNFTGPLGGVMFVDGEFTIPGPVENFKGLIHNMANYYGAFVNGSKEETAKLGITISDGDAWIQSEPNRDSIRDRVVVPAAEPADKKLVDAIKKLDPEESSHWTEAGKPSLAVVEAIMGRTDLTAETLEAALPDYNRTTAVEHSTHKGHGPKKTNAHKVGDHEKAAGSATTASPGKEAGPGATK